MSEIRSVYEIGRSGPDREEGIRQLIANLQAQNRQLVADRDGYAERMVAARDDAERLRAERDILIKALRRLWDTYIPSWAPAAALEAGEGLNPAWKLVAESLVSAAVVAVDAQEGITSDAPLSGEGISVEAPASPFPPVWY